VDWESKLRFASIFSSCMKKRLTRNKVTFMDLHLAHMMKIIMQIIFFINYNLFIIRNKPLNRLHPIPIMNKCIECAPHRGFPCTWSMWFARSRNYLHWRSNLVLWSPFLFTCRYDMGSLSTVESKLSCVLISFQCFIVSWWWS
jgi:hypothetical protein